IFLHGVALRSGFDTPSLPAQGGQRRHFRSSTSIGTSPPRITALPFLANAQDGQSMSGHSMSGGMAGMSGEAELPEACNGAAGKMDMSKMMAGMGK
ncbi:hypothetical protein VQ042_23810, partial [Aurantimonas sp. A2-1-M11]|uniref:hypothetical protein n=1 Tax=Aurantimonas sp. A2-1-M11 TaxID=3113712 RepID=UPI002FABCFA8